MESVSAVRCFGGTQHVYQHESGTLKSTMKFGVFLPDNIRQPAATLIWLSGLTCTEENFIAKAGAQRIASELGLILVNPDTSPRGETVPDDPDGAYDLGLGAGFYLNASQSPWKNHYQMQSYIEDEFHELILSNFPVDSDRLGILGHSMGGHGALTIALRSPDKYRTVSALAPICSPIHCPWGKKAFTAYLGADESIWRQYDSVALIEDGARVNEILVDQGNEDAFLESQLNPELLEHACVQAGIDLEIRYQPGYDHSFYFIASFIEDHLRWHNARLTG